MEANEFTLPAPYKVGVLDLKPFFTSNERHSILKHENPSYFRQVTHPGTKEKVIIVFRAQLKKANIPRLVKTLRNRFTGYRKCKLLGGPKTLDFLRPFMSYLPDYVDCKSKRETFCSEFLTFYSTGEGHDANNSSADSPQPDNIDILQHGVAVPLQPASLNEDVVPVVPNEAWLCLSDDADSMEDVAESSSKSPQSHDMNNTNRDIGTVDHGDEAQYPHMDDFDLSFEWDTLE